LNLKKRTDAPVAAEQSPSTGNKTDPFGNARPVDVSKQLEKDREIERKLAEQRKQDRLRSSDGPDRRNISSEKSGAKPERLPKGERPMPTQKESTFKLDTKSKFSGLGLDEEMNSSHSEEEEENDESGENSGEIEANDDLDLEAVEDPENQDWTAEVE
jgi:hypothetical protein